MHLFDVNLPSQQVEASESNVVEAGHKIVEPVKTPVGNVGLAIVSFFQH